MQQPPQILKRLIEVTGPISTFVMQAPAGGYTKGAYTILRISTTVRRGWYKRKGYLTHETKLTNTQVGKIIAVPSDDANAAIASAQREGRIRCNIIGSPDDPEAGRLLLQIARKLNFRKAYRSHIEKALKLYRKFWDENKDLERAMLAAMPDYNQPDYLGWRVWHWDPKKRLLISPAMHTTWHDSELRVPEWSERNVVRGYAGIHAARMPHDWRKANAIYHNELSGFIRYFDFDTMTAKSAQPIVGVVERYGRYVLGTEGWRAEWVIIKALRALNMEIGLALEQAYPDVEIVYDK